MPDWRQEIRKRLNGSSFEPARQTEIVEELAQHLEDSYREMIEGGATEEEASRVALEQLSDIESLTSELRRTEQPIKREPAVLGAGRGNMLEDLRQDLRFGVRMLRKNPAFTLIAVITLALGIGANTAVFSIIDGVLLRPLPYKDPQRLAFIWGRHAKQGDQLQQVSYLDFSDIRSRNEVFDEVAAMFVQGLSLTIQGESERVNSLAVSPAIFHLLGVEPALGRTFLPEEEEAGNERVALLSHRLWQNRFAGDPDAVGRAITLNSESYIVVGILPQGFDLEFPLSPSFSIADNDVWVPLTAAHRMAGNRSVFTYEVIARLKPGAGIEQARANLATISRQLEQAYPASNEGRSFQPVLAHEHIVGDVRAMILTLLAAVGLVLLIACANVANLLITRASARQKEIAIRAALGASRRRIASQLLAESLLLSCLGGLAGLMLATQMVGLLTRFPAIKLPRAAEIAIDGRVLLFTFALSAVTGLVFGLAPALSSSRADLHRTLKEDRQRTGGGGQGRLRNLLIISEIALAFLLLAGAGLLTVSFLSLLKVNPGFGVNNALTFAVSPPASKYPGQQQVVSYYQHLAATLEDLPGVQSVGVVSSLPLSGHNSGSAVRVEGRTLAQGEQPPAIGWQVALPGYFKTIGIPLIRGREFTEEDLARSQHVTIINEALAAQIFPAEDALGKRVTFNVPGSKTDWHEVIGIVGDVRHLSLDSLPQPRAYDLLGQHSGRTLSVVARTDGDPSGLAGAVRFKVRQLDGEVPIFDMATLEELAARSAAPRRFSMLLIGGFALIALLLAALGIYGVISYSVAERTHEIGVRMALGATSRDVLKMMLSQGLVLILTGAAIGLAASLVVTRFVSSLLFGVSPNDPLTLLVVAFLMISVALLACYFPARRATKVDPIVALRYE